MEQLNNLNYLSPAELRLLIRQEDPRISTTTGLADGKNQCVTYRAAYVTVHLELFVACLCDLKSCKNVGLTIWRKIYNISSYSEHNDNQDFFFVVWLTRRSNASYLTAE